MSSVQRNLLQTITNYRCSVSQGKLLFIQRQNSSSHNLKPVLIAASYCSPHPFLWSQYCLVTGFYNYAAANSKPFTPPSGFWGKMSLLHPNHAYTYIMYLKCSTLEIFAQLHTIHQLAFVSRVCLNPALPGSAGCFYRTSLLSPTSEQTPPHFCFL